ncbi:hypothetical protein BDZ97DRAFT_953677 [Flammula alnicola]|nr:hypothetical protein BDZ97DRAFT_953677 [Flammula alnicola]
MQLSRSQSVILRGPLIIICLLFLALICMPQEYVCVKGCSKSFAKSSSLVKHKNSCPHLLEIRQKSRQIHREKGDDAFPNVTSLSERKQRLMASFQVMDHQDPSTTLATVSTEPTAMDVDPPMPLSPTQAFVSAEPEPIPEPPPPPALTASGRPRREYRIPTRFRDILPEPLAPAVLAEEPQLEVGPVRRVLLIVRDRLYQLRLSLQQVHLYRQRRPLLHRQRQPLLHHQRRLLLRRQ